jgi:hypothetical protein
MNKQNYKEYLKTEHWRLVKLHFYQKNKEECAVCKSHLHLNLHHKTYARLGMELEKDLICLCKNCHEAVHKFNLVHLDERALQKLKKLKVKILPRGQSYGWKNWRYERLKRKKSKVNSFTKEQVEEYKKRINMV